MAQYDDRLDAAERETVDVLRKAPRTWQTLFGPVTVARRSGQDRTTGVRRFLLDTALGLRPRQRMAPGLWEVAVACAVETSYHGAVRILQQVVPHVDAMTLWHAVQRVGAAERAAQVAVAAGDVDGLPPTRTTETLYVEADGVWVRQRGGGSQEIKPGIAYEGKTTTGPERQALVARQVYAGCEDADTFWATATAQWSTVWVWDRIRTVHWGTDGGAWCRQGMAYLPHGVHHLDPYPVHQRIRTACGGDAETAAAVHAALAQADRTRPETVLTAAQARTRGAARGRRCGACTRF